MKNQTCDVILIGGGVISCATAYYLMKADPRLKVVILERDPSYEFASTPLSDGNTRIQFNIKENILMSMYGLQVLEHFTEQMAVGDTRPQIEFRRQGNLFLVNEEGRAEAERGLALQQSLGCRVHWLDTAEIRQRYPFLQPVGCAGGTLGLDDGTMDPWAVLIGYQKKAIALGAGYRHAEVAYLVCDSGRVTGVRLSSGETLAAGYLVNGAGAWAAGLARTAGIDLPVQPVKRQVFVLETELVPTGVLPAFMFPTGLYCIHEQGSHFMVGKSFADDPVGDSDFSWDPNLFLERIWEELVAYIPAFERLKVVRGWAGLYAVNHFDGNAILGEWPGVSGLLLANGFSGHGFQQCHAVGRYLAELILETPHALDLSIFSPHRILRAAPVFEGTNRII